MAVGVPGLFLAPLPTNGQGQHSIQRILIANRDATSQHVTLADESIQLGSIDQAGGNPYLNSELLIRVALEAGADGIHPGYGYLSENAHFATAVTEAGIKFIGPSADAMSTLGDKRTAKAFLRKNDPTVPLIPGFAGSSSDPNVNMAEIAQRIGYPVMLKASAGGGGKGMRIVSDPAQLQSEMERAQSEAQRFFGSSDCILEKYIESGKHIEIQIIGDSHGNIVSLGERDCSIQRRHQKVIEETPSPWLTDEKRKEMSDVAVQIGKLLRYENAGTVEFVFDVATSNFYFLEVNTRLQVEHPITEEVTRLDIVSLQIFVASGGDLLSLQPLQKVPQIGHAIECRLCAEDPRRDFYPSHGLIRLWKPATFRNTADRTVRFETGVATGSRISIYFDSMIAKIIVWEPNRALARAKMRRILAETACVGVVTNQLFLQSCLSHNSFSDPAYTTSFIPRNISSLLTSPYYEANKNINAAMPLVLSHLMQSLAIHPGQCSVQRPFAHVRLGFRNQAYDPINSHYRQLVLMSSNSADNVTHVCSWKARAAGRSNAVSGSVSTLVVPSSAKGVAAQYNEFSNAAKCPVPGQHIFDIETSIRRVQTTRSSPGASSGWIIAQADIRVDSREFIVFLATESLDTGYSGTTQTAQGVRTMCHIPLLGTWIDATCYSPLAYFEHVSEQVAETTQQKTKALTAPMPCKVLSILKKNGDRVTSGEKLMVVESMKMEINIMAPTEGTFVAKVQEKDAVDEGKLLCAVE